MYDKLKKTVPTMCMVAGLSVLTLCSCSSTKGSAILSKRKNAQLRQEQKSDATPYEKLVADSTRVSSDGLFGIYRSGDKLYFDIPDTLLHRDMLVVNRIVSVPPELNDAGINKGINYENTLIALERDTHGKHLLIRQIKPLPHYPSEDAIGLSVRENYVSPLMGRIKIEGFSADSTRILVDMTDFYNGSSTLLNNMYDLISIGGSINRDLSKIVRAKAFKDNVTVVSDLSTTVKEGRESVYLTVRSSSSIVLLPKTPMVGRYLSPKVGYFTVPYKFYADAQTSVQTEELITRWRLEPEDEAAYLRGELTRPTRPITFYIDRTTPRRWVPWIKKGIEDWNVAFEKAGFKEAIRAVEINDEIDPDDLSHSGINYVASDKMNAMGPSVYDPRSGEIIQADIIWWHNVLNILREWIILQTGAQRSEAATWQLPDDLLGDAMRFVACHEVGHSLGLRHNMIASSAYTIAQLRDPVFTSKNGTSPSIMDYARFNYVAQPGDGVQAFSPQIGAYDLYAIEYGYRWSGKGHPSEEKAGLAQFVAKHNGPEYRYSEAQDGRDAIDPRAQTEDLSDDPVAASTLGIANLKRLMPRVLEITKKDNYPHASYREAGLLYNQIANYWNLLLTHPMALVGGIYLESPDRSTPDLSAYTFVPKEKQRAALDFLLREGVQETDWLFDSALTKHTYPVRITPAGAVEQSPSLMLKNAQSYLFWDLLDNRRLIRMSENVRINGNKAFSPNDLTDRLFQVTFAKTIKGQALNVQDRFVEKGVVDALIQSVARDKVTKGKSLSAPLANDLGDKAEHAASGVYRQINFNGSLSDRISDAISTKRELLLRIRRTIEPLRRRGDAAMRGHYEDMALRIDHALEL